MRQRQLIIRADASRVTGVGHVMRCLAIAQAWQDAGGQSTFASRVLPESLRNRINKEGFETRSIHEKSDTISDAIQLIDIANDLDATAVVVDGYSFDVEYHRMIADSSFTSMAIDDHSSLEHYPTDFVLNQNIGVAPSSYRSRSSRTELLLGSSYALIRRELLAAGKRADKSSCEQILVTLGGSDPDNVTSKVITGLQQQADSRLGVRVILGSLNNHVESIVRQASQDVRFQVLHNIEDMSEHYLWADVVVAAGGSSNWEMCYFSLPRLLVVLVDNQVEIANELERRQIAVNLGNADRVKPQEINAALQRLMDAPDWMANARNQANDLVDGYGASRCVEHLLSHAKSRVRLSPS